MKCPKCQKEVSSKDIICPNCKKVLKFACLTIEFANIEDINDVLSSVKKIEKFRSNLDNLILRYCKHLGLQCEIVGDTYVINFDHERSFKKSAQDAVYTAIEIAKKILVINYKLSNAKAVSLEFKMTLQKSDVFTTLKQLKSGFKIKLISNYSKAFSYLNYVQILTDANICQAVEEDYSLLFLSSTYVNGEKKKIYELNLKKHLKFEEPKEEEQEEEVKTLDLSKLEEIKEMLNDEDDEQENKLSNNDVIIFDDMKCSFLHSNAYDIDKLVLEEVANNNKNIIMLKSTSVFKPDADKIISILKNNNVVNKFYRIACHEMMKYKPYGFFYDLLSVTTSSSIIPKLFSENNFSTMEMLDRQKVLTSMLELIKNENVEPDVARSTICEILSEIFKGFGKIAIYIDKFELIDESSYEILRKIWKDNENIVFIASVDMDYPIHKTSHFLLQNPAYSEIRLKPVSIKHILEQEVTRLSKFFDTHYFTNVLRGMKGSYIFFNCALSYLKEKNIIKEEKDIIEIVGTEMCVIPTDIEHLMIKKLQTLQSNADAFKLLYMMCQMSPMSNFNTLQLLEMDNLSTLLMYLANYNYITMYDANIFINNYDVTRQAFEKIVKKEDKINFANEIVSKMYEDSCKTVEEINLYRITGDIEKEQKSFENLSVINASLGEFSAYINCVIELSKILDKTLCSKEELEEFRRKVYENTSKLLNKYTPKKIYSVSENILARLEKSDDLSKLISFSIKMLKTYMICGRYSDAFNLVNKILARTITDSPNPEEENFSPSCLLFTIIRCIVLFSVGRLRECEEIGNEVIGYIKSPKLQEITGDSFTQGEYSEFLIDAFTFIGISKVFLLRNDDEINKFIDDVRFCLGDLPTQFKFLIKMKNVMQGKEIAVDLNSENDDKFGKIIKAVLRGFSQDKEDGAKFANDIYEAKICANINNYSQLETLFDLLIGYAYFKLNIKEKAKAIYTNVVELSEVNGFKLAGYIAGYLLSILHNSVYEPDKALRIANDTVSNIEKDNNVGDYMFYLFRILASGLYRSMGDEEKAQACDQSAAFVKVKDEILFGLDGVHVEVKERRFTDRRKRKEDFGGRRKGQRRMS